MFTRVQQNRATTLEHTFFVGETVTDSSTAVTYVVTDENGSSVATGTAASAGVGTGRYTFTLAAQAALKRGQIVYSATISGAATTETDQFEVVAGFFFTLAEGRASDASLADATKYPTADLLLKRTETEVECEAICDRSFIRRYDRVVLDGTGYTTLLLRPSDEGRSIADVRTIRRIAVAPQLDETFVDFTAGQLAAVAVRPDGSLQRTDGNVFTAGWSNIIVEYEYGQDRPPSDLVDKAKIRFRTLLNVNKSGISDRATSFTVTDGGTYRMDMPGPFKTGLPDVDAVYGRYSRRSTGSGPTARTVPASRTLSYNPQRGSLFHGRP